MKIFKKIIQTSLLLVVAVVIAASFYLFNFALKTKVAPTDEEDSYAYFEKYPYLTHWIDSLKAASAICDTTITAQDGAQLRALYVRAAQPTKKTALIIHGYTDNAIRMLMIGHLYNKKLDYNILLPDLRAHGKSDGEYIQMGWKDRLDMQEWIEVSKVIYGDSTQIALHGISMGAATALMMTGEELSENVKCAVADCGYDSVWGQYEYILKRDFGLPTFPILNMASMICEASEGWSFKEASALKQVEKAKIPIFYIHGDADTYVPTEMVYPLFEAAKSEKELWVIPHVEHARAYWDHTEEYVERTRNFVNKYL